MTYSLFLDDERYPDSVKWAEYPHKNWKIARNYDQFVFIIELHGLPDFISFDHDLGKDPRNGMECAKWLINFCERTKQKVPDFVVHSMNPVGRENITFLIENYRKHCE